LVLGKHSGRAAFANRLAELGYPLPGAELYKAFARFKNLADKKKHITDADLLALVSDELYQPEELYRLDALQVTCGTGMPTATVRLEHRRAASCAPCPPWARARSTRSTWPSSRS
jgi:2-isopropylmalate synthase